MGIIDTDVCLSSVQVHWSTSDAAFIARSDLYPGLVARNEWSSLAAIDTLIDLIDGQRRHGRSADRPAA
ncbi:hypothetical protein VMT65_15665 [Nocardia sp. CDC153]|uniref:hypothetical protein n=1 Tax=Nocardia sp. CDC153 TaxID=3112167 RepID=UPI002DBCBF17|nr:hypothetical protein [Nocardia sp. CDC153]MEC3954479.1 hypothetical protein [Nocardia sp. CDC153]